MAPSAMPTAAYASMLAISLYLAKRLLSARDAAPLPPGPKQLPIIGNLLDWPREREWETLTRWGALYGAITYCNLLGQRMIVLNSAAVVQEMLDRKGNIYSSRPSLYFASELVGWNTSVPLAPYGDRLRTMRRLLSKEIGSNDVIARFAPMEAREVRKFLRRVLDAPAADRLAGHIRKLTGSILLSASHGYAVVEEGVDPIVALAERMMVDIDAVCVPGAFLVDAFPVLDRLPNWFPGTGYRKTAERMRKTADAVRDTPHEWVKAQLAAGTAQPSFVASQLEGANLTPDEDLLLRRTGGAFFSAGSETTISAIRTFFLAITLHPEVQVRARKEIDAVVGTNRLPTLADRERLPYVEAVCKEVLRWSPPAPQGLPHASTEDDIHRGYLIPQGSYIFANIWGLTHDPDVYQNPASFDPSRFISEESREAENDPREYVFGFGRRICPGAVLFNSIFFATCATTLAALEVGKPTASDGTVVEQVAEFRNSGIFSSPAPFSCTIKPRSAKAEELVRETDD